MHAFTPKQKLVAGVASGVLVVGLGIGGAFALHNRLTQQPKVSETIEATVPDVAVETTVAKIALTAPATEDGTKSAPAGLTSTSTPAIIHLKGCCAKTEGIETYHAITADEVLSGTASVEVPTGRYDVEFISPINEDGSIYLTTDTHKVVVSTETRADHVAKVAEAEGISVEEADAKVEATEAEFTGGVISDELTQVPADQVTKEQVETILSKTAMAVEKGDTTLSGQNGVDLIQKVTEYAAKSGVVSGEQIDAFQTTAAENVSNNAGASATDKAKVVANGGTAEQANQAKPATGHWEMRTTQVTKYKSVAVQKTREVPVYGTEPVYKTEPVYETQPVYEDRMTGRYVVYYFHYDKFETTSKEESRAHQGMLREQDKDDSYATLTKEKYEKVQVGTKQVQVGTRQVQTGTRQVQTGTRTETYTVYENQPYTENVETKVWVVD